MKKLISIFILLLITLSVSAVVIFPPIPVGDNIHLRSIQYSFNGKNPDSQFNQVPSFKDVAPDTSVRETFQITPIPDTKQWTVVDVRSVPFSDEKAFFHVGIKNIDTGEWYYLHNVKPGENDRFTFPIPVHAGHRLELTVRCSNKGDKPATCQDYITIYAN